MTADSDPSLPVIEHPDAIRVRVQEWQRKGERVGLVPTMGALHEGHLSLMRAAKAECDRLVVTIFVNPAQFGPNEDLSRYPRPFTRDVELCQAEGVDVIFHPQPATMYPEGHATTVTTGGCSRLWEGAHRTGHFDGVTTVVLKLFLIVPADIAYFGLKDYQQQLLIRRMCTDLNVPIEIRSCPTVREPDGLALSSRNVFLSPDERQRALQLSDTLQWAEEQVSSGRDDIAAIRAELQHRLQQADGVILDYVTIADAGTLEELDTPREQMVALIAAKVGNTRLIDNRVISLERR